MVDWRSSGVAVVESPTVTKQTKRSLENIRNSFHESLAVWPTAESHFSRGDDICFRPRTRQVGRESDGFQAVLQCSAVSKNAVVVSVTVGSSDRESRCTRRFCSVKFGWERCSQHCEMGPKGSQIDFILRAVRTNEPTRSFQFELTSWFQSETLWRYQSSRFTSRFRK